MGLFNQFPWANVHEINLEWILNEIKQLITTTGSLTAALEQLTQELNELSDNLGTEVDKWLRTQGRDYVNEIIAEYITTSVYFGITDDGRFVAYIPASWDSITFNTTGLDINIQLQPEYGHLVLSY